MPGQSGCVRYGLSCVLDGCPHSHYFYLALFQLRVPESSNELRLYGRGAMHGTVLLALGAIRRAGSELVAGLAGAGSWAGRSYSRDRAARVGQSYQLTLVTSALPARCRNALGTTRKVRLPRS